MVGWIFRAWYCNCKLNKDEINMQNCKLLWPNKTYDFNYKKIGLSLEVYCVCVYNANWRSKDSYLLKINCLYGRYYCFLSLILYNRVLVYYTHPRRKSVDNKLNLRNDVIQMFIIIRVALFNLKWFDVRKSVFFGLRSKKECKNGLETC